MKQYYARGYLCSKSIGSSVVPLMLIEESELLEPYVKKWQYADNAGQLRRRSAIGEIAVPVASITASKGKVINRGI